MLKTCSGCLAAIAAFLLAACGEPEQSPAALGIDMPAQFTHTLSGHYTERVFHFNNYQPMNGGVAFVGDSITEWGDWEAMFPGLTMRNYGIAGDTTLGLERRISQVIAARPAKIFLLIGTNDLGDWGAAPAAVLPEYRRLLDRLAAEAPQARVYVQAVLPRSSNFAARVQELNVGIKALAEERRMTFVDIYTPFAVEGGGLDPAVTNDDLHLTADGYARWRTLIEPLVRSP